MISQPATFCAQLQSGNSSASSNDLPETQDMVDSRLLDDLWTSVLKRDGDIQFLLKRTGWQLSQRSEHISTFLDSDRRGCDLGVLLPKPIKNIKPTQEEENMMCQMLRDKAEKLMELLRDYTIQVHKYKSTCREISSLTDMENDSSIHESPDKLIEFNYWLKSSRRKLVEDREGVIRLRKKLCVIADELTVVRLDEDLKTWLPRLDSMDGFTQIDLFIHGSRKVLRGYDAF